MNRVAQAIDLNSPASDLSLAVIRIGAATVMLFKVFQKLPVYFTHFSWIQLLFFATMVILTLAMLIGYKSRAVSLILAFATGLIFQIQSHGSPNLGLSIVNISPHTFERDLNFWVVLVLLLSFSPCNRVLSVDSLCLSKIPSARRENRFPAVLGMRVLLISVYFWTALSKCNPMFLDGRVFESILVKYYTGSFSFVPTHDVRTWLSALAWFAVVSEFALMLGLTFKATRAAATAAGILMHLAFAVLLPVSHFSFLMILTYVLFANQKRVDEIGLGLLAPLSPQNDTSLPPLDRAN